MMPAELSAEQRVRRKILEDLPAAVRNSPAKPFVSISYIPALRKYDQEFAFDMLDILEHEGRVELRKHEVDRAVKLTPLGKQSLECSEEEWQASKRSASNTSVHISGGAFHQSPIGIGSNVTQSVSGTFGETPVFLELRNAIANVPDEDDRAKLCAGVDAMEKVHNTTDYVSRYANFMQLAANHMTVIAPFIPALAAFLNSH